VLATPKVNKYIDLTERANKLEEAGGSTAEVIKLRTRALEYLGANEKYIDPARAKFLSPEEVMLRNRIMDEAGLAGTGKELKSVNHAQFLSFLTQKSGRRLVDKMVETTNPAEINLLHKNKIGMKAADDLAAATTPEEVVAVYMRQFTDPGEDLITAVPNMGLFRQTEKGLWIRNTFNPYVKFRSDAPRRLNS
jgi:hypothetical protein